MGAEFRPVSLAAQVAAAMRGDMLKTATPGARLRPVRELADELGVSVPTVRAAQSVLAGEGLLEIRHGSGVYVKEPTGGQRRIGIVSEMDLLRPRGSSFFAATICALRDFVAARDMETELFIGESLPGAPVKFPSVRGFVREVEAGRLDGAVLVSWPELYYFNEFLQKCTIPLVGAQTDYHAGTDYRELVAKGFHALAAQGGQRVGVLGAWFGPNADEAELRDVARSFGMELLPGWTRHDLHPQLRGAGWEEFREIWSAHREKPDALLVTDDVLFADAQIAILEMGIRVPDQLRIATHVNAGAEPRPPFPVTLLKVDAAWCAERLGEMLIQRMNGASVEPGLRAVPVEVVEAGERAVDATPPSRDGEGKTARAPLLRQT